MRNLFRFLSFYRSDLLQVFSGVLLSLAILGSSIGLLTVSGWFITAMGLAGVAGVTMNYFTPAAIIRGCAIIRTAGRYAERLDNHDVALRVTSSFRLWFYNKLEPLAPANLLDLHSGNIFNRLRGDVDVLERFYLHGFIPLVTGLVALLFMAVGLCIYYLPFGILQISLLVAAGIIIPFLLQKGNVNDQNTIAEQMTRLHIKLADTLQSLGEALIYGGGLKQAGSILEQEREILDCQKKINIRNSMAQSFLVLCMGLAVCGSLFLIIPLVTSGDIKEAHLGMVPLLSLACFDAVIVFPQAIQSVQAAIVSARRVFEIADRKVVSSTKKAQTLLEPTFHLELKDVGFSYASEPVLAHLNLSLSSGEVLALTGKSGSGKSTVINLLTGFWQASAGEIALNGQNIANISPENLREQFAVAPQKPHLFADTIRANLLLANPRATQRELDEACMIAGLSEAVAQMPEGFNTYIGENGARISGGQARRLSIARAVLKKSPCLILDEPGEGLDRKLELEVMKSVIQFAKTRNQAIIICAHRADTDYLGADAKIVVL